MDNLKNKIKGLIAFPSEQEWGEFKENWFEPHEIGEFISSLSNTAAILGRKTAYLIWEVNNETPKLTNTSFNYLKDIKNEPLEHFLARQISPDINFKFEELFIDRKRVVVLVIPAAEEIPTAFNNSRYIRIGSSKVNLNKFPERESKLFDILRNGLPTMENIESYYQSLSFRKLFLYYENKGIILNKNNFKKNLGLLTKKGKYNLLAQLLSDDSKIPVRVSIFKGKNKASPLYSVGEFGNTCLLITLDKILEFSNVLNIMQADETNRIVERKEVPLFNQNAFREAIINAFVHNLWIEGNAPMISVFSNRIEILSRGTLAPNQTLNGFFLGESVPVNRCLSDIFLQLHISERSGRGVPIITDIYGRNAFEFRDNSIVTTIPFDKLNQKYSTRVGDKALNITQGRILKEIEKNSKITQVQLMKITGLGRTSIQKNISYLRKFNYIERVGSNKNGYWKINE